MLFASNTTPIECPYSKIWGKFTAKKAETE